jgi:hypothetical protein
MNATLYVSSLQDRAFLALAGLALALFIDSMRGLIFRHNADPRPPLERIADALLYVPAFRLNRAGRSDGALIMRGVLVLVIGCVLFFSVIGGAFALARAHAQGGLFLAVLVALSTTATGWFFPLRALAKAVGDAKAPRPYLVLSRATYSNLVTLDEGGLIRVAVTAALRSLILRTAAPIVLFVLFGWQILAVYWPILLVALAMGRDGTGRAFAAVANMLASVLLIIPTLLLFPVILAALFFSAGSSFFRALPGFFNLKAWPSFLQGGLPLLIIAYAMKLTLGGPRQDRAGVPVPAPWIGPGSGTAKLEPRDIGRVLYLQGVTLLLIAAITFVVAVL